MICYFFLENFILYSGVVHVNGVPDLSWLLAAIGAKLIGPHGGLQVDKQKVCQVTGSVDGLTHVRSELKTHTTDIYHRTDLVIQTSTC